MQIQSLFTKSATNGAIIDPILAHVEQDPNAKLLIDVWNTSTVYKYIMEKAAVIPNLPIMFNTIIVV